MFPQLVFRPPLTVSTKRVVTLCPPGNLQRPAQQLAHEKCPLSICLVNDLFMKAWFREVTSLDVYFRKMTSVESRLEERYIRKVWFKKQVMVRLRSWERKWTG